MSKPVRRKKKAKPMRSLINALIEAQSHNAMWQAFRAAVAANPHGFVSVHAPESLTTTTEGE